MATNKLHVIIQKSEIARATELHLMGLLVAIQGVSLREGQVLEPQAVRFDELYQIGVVVSLISC